jgi:hypothetical protein
VVFSQIAPKEIGIITDNDLYTSTKNDQYYTNGIEVFYRFLGKNTDKTIHKKIYEFSVGQYIFTSSSIIKDSVSVNDRPFAGYIFAKASKTIFYQNESVFKKELKLGYVGPNAFGEETQNGFHKLFGYNKIPGWENQINNALVVQSHFLFSKKLFPKQNQKTIDVNFLSEANLGSGFTGISTGFLSRIGFKTVTPIYNSNVYGAAIDTDVQKSKTIREFYFYIAPSINYQLYDATIQGSLFNDKSPITYSLIPLRFNGEAGIKYRKNNMNLSYSFVYRGKELKNEYNTGYFYGSILLSFLLN